ncbi:CHAT domain-containing protein [Tenacibaculum sp. nBUS_03]|uniref:CHAT domain-containing protein n=1 Tax=Tenacibaculum sp. nBUS_03 TaxID=3395320 RepID=UPI003EBF117A
MENRKTNTDLVVFAPVNFKNTELSPLENTEKEAAVITNLVGGDSFTNSNATKENFVRKTSNAKIIHLATHATATNNPSIQFFTNDLKLHELYTYKNNADLVVLSACETNIGELKQGEGVLNLARGFFHSGTNSVVSSIWKINDASSSFIMKEFYSNLKDKQSKTEALNNAKRAYLKKHSLSEQSPYYWASFVLIGDTSPVFTTNYFYYISIVLIIGLLVFLFFRRKNKSY